MFVDDTAVVEDIGVLTRVVVGVVVDVAVTVDDVVVGAVCTVVDGV